MPSSQRSFRESMELVNIGVPVEVGAKGSLEAMGKGEPKDDVGGALRWRRADEADGIGRLDGHLRQEGGMALNSRLHQEPHEELELRREKLLHTKSA
jgi:hypothetical protein